MSFPISSFAVERKCTLAYEGGKKIYCCKLLIKPVMSNTSEKVLHVFPLYELEQRLHFVMSGYPMWHTSSMLDWAPLHRTQPYPRSSASTATFKFPARLVARAERWQRGSGASPLCQQGGEGRWGGGRRRQHAASADTSRAGQRSESCRGGPRRAEPGWVESSSADTGPEPEPSACSARFPSAVFESRGGEEEAGRRGGGRGDHSDATVKRLSA